MRIPAFSHFYSLQAYELKNTTVVVDGQNIFYSLYEKSNLPALLGSECDKFAEYVRNYLEMFKINNLKCLFVIKGGHTNEHMLNVHIENRKAGFIQPILAKDVFMQVLKEMDFDFTICDTSDVIKVCFELAQTLSCPVVAFNIQYCFGPAPYIPLPRGTSIKNEIFKRENFLKQYNITEGKMILFIILTDYNIFEENVFLDFFRLAKIKLKSGSAQKFTCLLNWLSRKNETEALNVIFKCISKPNGEKFMKAKEELELKFLRSSKEKCAALLYFTDRRRLDFNERDPLWFQKGIALKHIAIPYINLYTYEVITASRLEEDNSQENTIVFAIDIIKYAFDLLQNFNGKQFAITEVEINNLKSVNKPKYAAVNCVFENGWSRIESRKLFEHFFLEKLGSFNFSALEIAPADSRLLLISMVYFTRNKDADVEGHMWSVVLSYVLLGVIADKLSNDKKITFARSSRCKQPLSDNTTDKDLVTVEDCRIAKDILMEYHKVATQDEARSIFRRTKIHPLLQFERCLQEINYLNQLCGSPYSSTQYRKTYSATFVYSFLDKIEGKDAMRIIRNMLRPAPSVLSFALGMFEVYKNIVNDF